MAPRGNNAYTERRANLIAYGKERTCGRRSLPFPAASWISPSPARISQCPSPAPPALYPPAGGRWTGRGGCECSLGSPVRRRWYQQSVTMQKKKPTFRIEPFRHKLEMDPNYADKTWKVLEDAIHEIHNKNASGLSFEELYRSAYNMVLHKFGDRLYSGLVSTITGHLHKIAAEVDASQDEQFLAELNQRWNDHNKSMQMIRDILMYMDRTYVQQQRKGILLDFVKRERSGELIDKQLMRATTKMLVDLGHRVYVDDFEVHFLAAASDFYK
eukprot:jgi/Tetstr1/457595/TSEL_044163.t1